MNLRPVMTSLAIVAAASIVAFGSGLAVHSVTSLGAVGACVAIAAVVVALFAWRPIDGLACFWTVVLLANPVEHWSTTDLRYIDEIAVPALAVLALTVHRSRLVLPRPGWREAALSILLLAGVASSLVNAVPSDVWIPALGLLGKGFLFFYLVASWRIDLGDISRIGVVVAVVGSAIVLIGIAQWLSPELVSDMLRLPGFNQQRGSVQVVNSIFTHPAIYGWITVFLSLFLFARAGVLREPWSLVLAMLLGIASVLSGRRTPLIGLVAGVLVGAARQAGSGRSVVRTALPALTLAALVVGIAVWQLGGHLQRTLEEYGEPPELIAEVFADDPDPAVLKPMAARNALYLGSVAVARDHLPLGAGLGRFGSHMSREQYSPVYAEYGLDRIGGILPENPIAIADTFWPMILGETGLVGLLAALAFIGILTRDLWNAAGPAGSPAVRAFALGALLVFVEGIVRSATSAVYVAPPIAYFVLGAAGLSLALTRTEAPAPAPR